MNLLKTKKQVSAIGLDMDDHEFRAVQLVRSNGQSRVRAWAVFPRLQQQHQDSVPDEKEILWAASVLNRRGFSGSTISCAPRNKSCSHHVFELPPAESGAPIDHLARIEVARARKCEPTDVELGCWALPQRGRISETMAVACETSVINDLIGNYEAGGLDVAGIDLPEHSIMRGVLNTDSISRPPGEDQIDAILHVSWNSALAIVTLGQRIVYVRRIENGASVVWEMANDRFALSPMSARGVLGDHEATEHTEQLDKLRSACWSALAKELASELDVAMAYVSHGFRVAPLGKIVMCGYGAMNSTIMTQLDQVLGIPIECSAPQQLRDCMQKEQHEALAARLTMAYGLAARFDA